MNFFIILTRVTAYNRTYNNRFLGLYAVVLRHGRVIQNITTPGCAQFASLTNSGVFKTDPSV